MSANYDEIRKKNIKEYGEGSRHLSYFADIYSTRTHFLYEILQNAEDALSRRQSSNLPGFVQFKLHTHSLEIRHNGNPFSESDVIGICGIGEGTKAGDYTQIGKFGIGFKSVYAYTFFPRIQSGTEHFEIRRFVEPRGLPTKEKVLVSNVETHITLPFDQIDSRPDWAFRDLVAPEQAVREIGTALRNLDARTLLFLTHVAEIKWELPDGSYGHLKKNIKTGQGDSKGQVIEVTNGTRTEEWRVFRRRANIREGSQVHNVSVEIAFLIEKGKVARAQRTELVVYFPTEKETKLGFLIQAPFKATKARDNIKTDDSANHQILDVAASLTVDSLIILRTCGMLDVSSFNALPLRAEDFPLESFFRPIYNKVRESLKIECLLPAHRGEFIRASEAKLARGKELPELFTAKQLADLFGKDKIEWLDSNITSDKFPDIHTYLVGRKKQYAQVWEVDPLIEGVQVDAESLAPRLTGFFLEKQEISWLIRFALYVASNPSTFKRKQVPFIRLENGQQVCLPVDENKSSTYYLAPKGPASTDLSPFLLVAHPLAENQEIRSFLEKEGIREVDEGAQVRAILKARYTAEDFKPDIKDLSRFVAFVEKDPDEASIFCEYFIFKREDGRWGKPSHVFLDLPHFETMLSAYYGALRKDGKKKMLSDAYLQCEISSERLRRFAELVGVQTRLLIERTTIWGHPLKSDLCKDILRRNTHAGINEDWWIPELEELLKNQSEKLSQLIWHTLCHAGSYILKAKYSPNRQCEIVEKPSSLVLLLQRLPWIPQNNGEFVVPSKASVARLPKEFRFDEDYEWLRVVGFGEEELRKSEEYRRKQSAAAELGFADKEALRYVEWFASLDPETRRGMKESFENGSKTELPENVPTNPSQRAARVRAQAVDAPERSVETRLRSVSVNREAIKQEARLYLRDQYTNPDGEMICQACKTRLPFKLDDGSYYVENVEFLAVKNDLDGLKKHYHQNYLALCPNHRAMFQHANGAPELMKEMFAELEGDKLEVLLAQENATIYFTKKHIFDLKEVIKVDDSLDEDIGNDEAEGESVPLRGIA